MPAIVRSMTRPELDQLLRWAADEGWNPGLADAEVFYRADPKGFLGCFVDGELAAGISALAYDDQFGFIGLYICHPRFRGQGYGRQVWDAGMAILGNRVIGLDGVPEQQANYAAMGFAPLYETVRWSGKAAPIATTGGAIVQRVTVADIAEIIALDRHFFPAPRESFVTGWLTAPRHAFCTKEGGVITGYAVLREGRDAHKVGPIFATEEETAEALIAACFASAAGCPVQLDVPEHQIGLAETLARLGFTPSFRTARMYRGGAPSLSLAGVYAVTTLELG